MYSYEDRIKAVQLYIKYNRSAAATTHQLGYPSRKNLRRWYQTYVETGDLPERSRPKPKYSSEQKQKAVDYYFSHGCCLARTKTTLGYPGRETLSSWIDELQPGARMRVTGKVKGTALSRETKQDAVIKLCSRQEAAAAVAEEFGVSRQILYKRKGQLLGDKVYPPMERNNKSRPVVTRDSLEQEVESLKNRIHRLQLEHDILKKANELLKKDQGVNLQVLNNREKTLVIDALRATYTLSELFVQLGASAQFLLLSTRRACGHLISMRISAVLSRISLSSIIVVTATGAYMRY